MTIVRPTWSTWSFLVYAGGLTFAVATFAWLAYLSGRTGPAGDVGWALLAFGLLAAIAEASRRTGHPVAAGVFAVGTVGGGAAVAATVFDWIGWHVSSPPAFHGLHPALLALEALTIALAAAALRRYRFPLLVWPIASGTWLLVADLLSNGGNWTAFVSLLIGLTYLAVAVRLDGGERRPYGFWLHVAAGLAIGGSILYAFRHGGTFEWVLVAVASVAYVLLARQLGRSSWAVLGTVGLFVVAGHFAVRWTNVSLFFIRSHGDRPWVPPLVFTCLGALLVALGLAVSRSPADA